MSVVKKGHFYQHHKNGHIYEILAIAKHSETNEELVIYARSDLEEPGVWARPRTMFEENVEYNGQVVPRFAHVCCKTK